MESLTASQSAAPGDLIFVSKYPYGFYAKQAPFGNGPLSRASIIGVEGLNALLAGKGDFLEGVSFIDLSHGRKPGDVRVNGSFVLSMLDEYRLDGVVVSSESVWDSQNQDAALNIALQGVAAVSNGFKSYDEGTGTPPTGVPVHATREADDYVGRVSGKIVRGGVHEGNGRRVSFADVRPQCAA